MIEKLSGFQRDQSLSNYFVYIAQEKFTLTTVVGQHSRVTHYIALLPTDVIELGVI